MTAGKPSGSTALDTTFEAASPCVASGCHGLAAAAAALDATDLQQTAPAFSYTGRWTTMTSSYASGGSLCWTARADSDALVTVTGPGTAVLYGLRYPYGGYATVSVDGGPPELVDCFSNATAWNSALFASEPLPAGPHTIAVDVLGTKRPESLGARVPLDRVRVIAPAPGADPFAPPCSDCHADKVADHAP
jgi:mono/diheme cytochrome c family protein